MKVLKQTGLLLAVLTALGFQAQEAFSKPQIGRAAPDFSGETAKGDMLKLDDLKGKIVVLEWTNKDCPYVRKHYANNNMQALQRESKTDHAVTWVSIISSAPGTQGYLEPAEALLNVEATKADPDYVMLDPDGVIGKSYGAVTTPHMYVIDPEGELVFMGGIDDKPYSRYSSLEGAFNYVRAALDDMEAGRAVAQPVAQPYGCSIKYKN